MKFSITGKVNLNLNLISFLWEFHASVYICDSNQVFHYTKVLEKSASISEVN